MDEGEENRVLMTAHKREREKRATLSKTSLYCIEDSTEDRQKKKSNKL